LLPVGKLPVEAKLTPVVAIWAAAVVEPVVSSAPSQAVRAAAKGIAHRIYTSLNSSVKKLLIYYYLFSLEYFKSILLKISP